MKRAMMQAYVKNSGEAVEMYKKAFDAEVSNVYKDEDGSYIHAELNICGNVVSLSELGEDVKTGNTMQFCFHYGEGNEEKIKRAYEVLKEGAEIDHVLGECFFSPLMASFTDRFGVSWCLFI